MACIGRTLCQKTLLTWYSLLEPVIALYAKPIPIINGIVITNVLITLFFFTIFSRKDPLRNTTSDKRTTIHMNHNLSIFITTIL